MFKYYDSELILAFMPNRLTLHIMKGLADFLEDLPKVSGDTRIYWILTEILGDLFLRFSAT